MSEIREMLIDTTNKMMKDLCTKDLINEVEQGTPAVKLWETLKESGMTTVGVSEDVGGSGGTIGDALHMLVVAGEFAAPVPLTETLMANWFLAYNHLPISSGPLTIASINNDDGFPFKKDEEGWVISGNARSVPWAEGAEKLAVLGNSGEGVKIAIIDTSHCKIKPGQNLAGEPRSDVLFNKVKVGEDGVFPSVLDSNQFLLIGSLTRVALMAGGLQRLLDLTVQYSKERTQFGRSIGRFQAIQQHLAVLAGEVTSVQVAANVAIERFESDQNEAAIMAAKIRAGEAASKACPIAHQVLGAIGFTNEHALHHITRRLWSWRDEFGTESDWAKILGEKVVHNGANRLWSSVTSGRI
jgi:acyl-CoA dehydrogenase